MSYEVIAGKLYGLSADDRHHGNDGSPVDEAVADALDVLRAARWNVWTDDRPRDDGSTYTSATSPRRKVDGADDGE